MNRTLRSLILAGAATAAMSLVSTTFAQSQSMTPPGVDPATHAAHQKQNPGMQMTGPQPGMGGDANADLVSQVAALRAEVAKLQAALARGHAVQPSSASGMANGQGGMAKMQAPMGSGQMTSMPAQPIPAQPMPGAGGMAGMPGAAPKPAGGGMGMMDMDATMMGGMSGAQPAGMGGMPGGASGGGMGMDGMMQMMGMGSMPMGGAGSPAAMNMPSALPGFPGASHIYHVGATGFFLDHREHITLTLEQQTALNQKKELTLLQQSEFQRKVEQAEQELWVLTAADQPDATMIGKKVQEVALLQADQRVAFIRAVGEAAQMLTDEQRRQLTGMLPPAPMPAMTPMAPASQTMPAGGGMADM